MTAPITEASLTDALPTGPAGASKVPTLAAFKPRWVTLVPSARANADVIAGDVLAATEIWAAVVSGDDTGGYCTQLNVHLLDRTIGSGLKIVFLKANVSIAAESSAYSIADADVVHVLGEYELVSADFKTKGASCMAELRNIRVPCIPVSASDDIYIGVVSTDGINLGAVTDLVLNGFFE